MNSKAVPVALRAGGTGRDGSPLANEIAQPDIPPRHRARRRGHPGGPASAVLEATGPATLRD
ncbi:hypothetical protein [Streptacidiphilus neutrinimicus]|uniref:hypothetical protein n=1 Tax=Streptacidiphilus neutrinimicus TaxID=105420 RepID=UPI0005A93F80|nr:hypothetical protein [Streptacidiphilus neutrinimicus]